MGFPSDQENPKSLPNHASSEKTSHFHSLPTPKEWFNRKDKEQEKSKEDRSEDTSAGSTDPLDTDDPLLTPNAASFSCLFGFLRTKHIACLSAGLFFAILSGSLVPIESFFLGRVFNALAEYGGGKISSKAMTSKIAQNCLWLLLLAGASWLIFTGLYASWSAFGQLQTFSARQSVFESLLRKNCSWYDLRKDGPTTIATRVQNDINEFQKATSQCLGLSVRSLVSAVASLGLSLRLSWKLTLVTVATVPIAIAALAFFTSRIEPNIERQAEKLSEASKLTNTAFCSIESVKCYNSQSRVESHYASILDQSSRFFFCLALWSAAQSGFVRFANLTMFVQAFWFGSTLVHSGQKSPGEVITTFYSALMATEAIVQILPIMLVLDRGKMAAARLKALQQSTPSDRTHYTDENPTGCPGDLTLESLTFSYPTRPHEPSLRNVTMYFASGETSFIIGKSGSGKSTIGQLLVRFYDPDKGRIFLGQTPLSCLNPDWIRRNVLLVEQHNTLFSGTVRENIALGGFPSELITQHDIARAVEMASLHQAIDELPDKLDTQVGSRGMGLSGGQRQRISLARARIRDAPIVILDECTSALDAVNRAKVMNRIRAWRHGRTTIVITHDIRPIMASDYVYVMDKGEVIEEGFWSSLGRIRALYSEHQNQPAEAKTHDDTIRKMGQSSRKDEGVGINDTSRNMGLSNDEPRPEQLSAGSRDSIFSRRFSSVLGSRRGRHQPMAEVNTTLATTFMGMRNNPAENKNSLRLSEVFSPLWQTGGTHPVFELHPEWPRQFGGARGVPDASSDYHSDEDEDHDGDSDDYKSNILDQTNGDEHHRIHHQVHDPETGLRSSRPQSNSRRRPSVLSAILPAHRRASWRATRTIPLDYGDPRSSGPSELAYWKTDLYSPPKPLGSSPSSTNRSSQLAGIISPSRPIPLATSVLPPGQESQIDLVSGFNSSTDRLAPGLGNITAPLSRRSRGAPYRAAHSSARPQFASEFSESSLLPHRNPTSRGIPTLSAPQPPRPLLPPPPAIPTSRRRKGSTHTAGHHQQDAVVSDARRRPVCHPHRGSGGLHGGEPYPKGRKVHRLHHRRRLHTGAQSVTRIIYGALWAMRWRDRVVFGIGVISATVYAVATPAFAFVFSRLLQTYYDPVQENNSRAVKLSLLVLLVAAIDGLSCFVMNSSFQACGQAWTNDTRNRAMQRILAQPKAFFDRPKNSPGLLAETLDSHAEEMQGLLGRFSGYLFIAAGMFVTAVTWSLTASWKLTLVGLSVTPVLYAIGAIQERVSGVLDKTCNDLSSRTGAIFYETISSLRTVRALTLELRFLKLHTDGAEETFRAGLKKGAIGGVLYGLSNSAFVFFQAFIFYYASKLASRDPRQVRRVIESINMLIFSMSNIQMLVSFVPQMSTARDSSNRVLTLACGLPETSHEDRGEGRLAYMGEISFRGVTFAYPGRPDHPVLNDVTFNVPRGLCTVIIGRSGSGKSTLAALLLKLYSLNSAGAPEPSHSSRSDRSSRAGGAWASAGRGDEQDLGYHTSGDGGGVVGGQVGWMDSAESGAAALEAAAHPPRFVNKGQITLTGQDLSTIHTRTLRSLISVVSQMPTILPTTIGGNILYGLEEGSPLRTQANMIASARAVGIDDFISSLEKGYETEVGDGGGQTLSGGQAQRMVIARALARRPHVLVLDEATSALDPDSAKLVKDSVENLMRGRGQGRDGRGGGRPRWTGGRAWWGRGAAPEPADDGLAGAGRDDGDYYHAFR